MKRMNYRTPESTEDCSSWEEIFLHPGDIKIHIWNTATIEIPSKGVYNSKYPNAPALEKAINVPVPVYYLQYSDGRGVLIDAGLDKALRVGDLQNAKGLLKKLVLPQAQEDMGKSATDRLASGRFPLDAVFLTHMHFDHTGGLTDMPGDTRVLVGKGEPPMEIPLLFRTTHIDHLNQIEEINFSHAPNLAPFGPVVDIWGDSSVFAIPTPGHTPGHTGYLINSTQGIYLITGDAMSLKENRDFGVPPGSYSSDLELAEQSFRQIMEFINRYPQVKLLWGHALPEPAESWFKTMA